jgi:predicted transcriptional regulator
MGDQCVSPREFPGLPVDQALPLTLQEHLRRTNAVSLIQISNRGYYQSDANGDQPLTEATLFETLIVMRQHIRAIENILGETRAARAVTEERLRNAELLVRFIQSETAAKRTQVVKRPREETDP